LAEGWSGWSVRQTSETVQLPDAKRGDRRGEQGGNISSARPRSAPIRAVALPVADLGGGAGTVAARLGGWVSR